MPEPFISYAQTMEDVMLWRALGDAGPGFYIDVGAADPDRLSVTRAFYERGWHGLDVEPLPEQAARLREARPRDVVIEAALAAAPGTATFHRVRRDGDLGLSTLDPAAAGRAGGVVETLPVEVTTLAALCRAHVTGPVHFLKVDVEGAEEAVLRGADFARVRPWIVVVEAALPGSGAVAEAAWEPILLGAAYVFVWFDGLNRFYVAGEHHAALALHFQVPPNPFDHYKVADLPREELLAAARALAEARLEVIQDLEAKLAQQPAGEVAPPKPPSTAAPPGRSLARRVAERVRAFLTADLAGEIAALRAQQTDLLARLDRAPEPVLPPVLSPVLPIDAELGRAAQRLLLTLALERD